MWMISCLNLKRIFLGELFCWGGGMVWFGWLFVAVEDMSVQA